MGFSGGNQGHPGHQPHDDDEKEEDDDEVEDNNKVEDNDKDDNNFKDISALRLDRDLGFLRAHQGYHGQQKHWPPYDDRCF